MPKVTNSKPIAKITVTKNISKETLLEFTQRLEDQFYRYESCFSGVNWDDIYDKLVNNLDSLQVLYRMGETGGEPGLMEYDASKNQYIFADLSEQSPQGRRKICYDREGEEKRNKKGLQLVGNALDLADQIGCKIMDEEMYFRLQKIGKFDTKTSSWLLTSKSIRDLGGAIFGDSRYETTFVYHNGADSFYSDRGFRGFLVV